jgi:AraC-like DNA-binding protein
VTRVAFRRPCKSELRPWVSAVWWCQGAAAAESVLPARRKGWRAGTAQLIGDVQRGLRQGHSVATVAARLAVDRRTLGTLLRREVGFGLKRYARLARFEQALRAVRAEDAPSLGLVAAQLAFADQPHLTREFRYFAGFAPGCLHRVPGPTPWHVLNDETFKTARSPRGNAWRNCVGRLRGNAQSLVTPKSVRQRPAIVAAMERHMRPCRAT